MSYLTKLARNAILIGLAGALLAGCGSGNSSGNGNASPSGASPSASPSAATSADASPAAGATRVYPTIMGDEEIPVEPKRVVATQYLGHLLTLGVKPVGVGAASLEQYFLKDLTDGIENIGDDSSLEKILELQPDLIIRPSDKNYEQFAKIAPTIVIPWGQKDVYDELREFGDIFGKQEEAEAAIARFEEKVAEAKTKLDGVVGPDETVGVYEIWAKNFWAVGTSFGRGTRNLYTSLGFQPPEPLKPYVTENGGPGLDMSFEKLPENAADFMFVTVYGADGGDKRADEIMDSELWRNLPAVKNDRVFLIDIDQFAANDLISMEKQLEIQVDLLLGSVK